ncbi:MAG: hypothetical protein Q7R81_03125 [Candidatus Peregrinibacteria bacterium]|nr:hypothetical protein [Candidatus Peregrinibacteria bacterium]
MRTHHDIGGLPRDVKVALPFFTIALAFLLATTVAVYVYSSLL